LWSDSDSLIVTVCLFSKKAPWRWSHELPKHAGDHNTMRVHLYIEVQFFGLEFYFMHISNYYNIVYVWRTIRLLNYKYMEEHKDKFRRHAHICLHCPVVEWVMFCVLNPTHTVPVIFSLFTATCFGCRKPKHVAVSKMIIAGVVCDWLYTGCFRRNSKYFRKWQYGLFWVNKFI